MKTLFTPFIDKFRSDWAFYLEHWEAYALVCVVGFISVGIILYFRLREK